MTKISIDNMKTNTSVMDVISQLLKDHMGAIYLYGPSHGQQPYEAVRHREGVFSFNMKMDGGLGMFAMIVDDVWLHVNVYTANLESMGEVTVTLSLNYFHPGGGSNGYNIGCIWFNVNGEPVGYRGEGKKDVRLLPESV